MPIGLEELKAMQPKTRHHPANPANASEGADKGFDGPVKDRFVKWLEAMGGEATASRKEIAKAIGTTQRTIAVVAKKLEREGVVDVERSMSALGPRKNTYRLVRKHRAGA